MMATRDMTASKSPATAPRASVLTEARVASELSLSTPDGGQLQVVDLAVQWRRAGREIRALTISFSVAFSHWSLIDERELFQLSEACRGPLFGGVFDPSLPVLIDALLDPTLLARVHAPDDIFDIAIALHKAEPDDPLRCTESYYATRVKQQHGPVQYGFSTVWWTP